MAIVTIDDTYLNAIGAAIRERSGTDITYRPKDMANAIGAIETKQEIVQEITYVAGIPVLIPEGLTIIPTGYRTEDDTVTCIFIPKSVKTIERGAFTNCRNLTTIIFEDADNWDAANGANGSYDPIHSLAFSNCPLRYAVCLTGTYSINIWNNAPWGGTNSVLSWVTYN